MTMLFMINLFVPLEKFYTKVDGMSIPSKNFMNTHSITFIEFISSSFILMFKNIIKIH